MRKAIISGVGLLILVGCSSQSDQERICSDSTYATGAEPASTVSLQVDCTFRGGNNTGDGGPGTLTNCNVLFMEVDLANGPSAIYDGGSAFQTLSDGGLAANSAFQSVYLDGGDNEPQFLLPLPAAAPPLDDGSLPAIQVQIPYSLAMPGLLNVGDGTDTSSCWAQGQCAGVSVSSAAATGTSNYSLGTVSGGNLTITNIGFSDGSQITLQGVAIPVNPPASSTEAVCSDGKIHYLP